MFRWFFLFLMLATTSPAFARPVVLELFTSQGCSSCPPADHLLAELSQQDDILAFAYHVDYWDRLGWKDPFSSPKATARQHQYAGVMKLNRVYTPQLVINGQYELVGSRDSAVRKRIEEAKRSQQSVEITLEQKGSDVAVTIPAQKVSKPLHILAIHYQPHASTRVKSGENSGRTLVSTNIVRRMELLGSYQGDAFNYTLSPAEGQSVAVVLQGEDGVIVGAAR